MRRFHQLKALTGVCEIIAGGRDWYSEPARDRPEWTLLRRVYRVMVVLKILVDEEHAVAVFMRMLWIFRPCYLYSVIWFPVCDASWLSLKINIC